MSLLKRREPCMAVTLVNPSKPEEAGSYLWCSENAHSVLSTHLDYSGIQWTTSDLVEPTENMRKWRTGPAHIVALVSGRMMGSV